MDFPLSEITLYGCWDQEHWVIMLPRDGLHNPRQIAS